MERITEMKRITAIAVLFIALSAGVAYAWLGFEYTAMYGGCPHLTWKMPVDSNPGRLYGAWSRGKADEAPVANRTRSAPSDGVARPATKR